MSTSALVCLVPGSEEAEAVTTINLLIRGGIKIITASVVSDGNLAATCSHGIELPADVPLVEVADGEYDVIVLPGGTKDAEYFRDSALLVETVKQFHRPRHIITAICAVPTTVLAPHDIFLIGSATDFPALRDEIPVEQWQDGRVIWDTRIKLLTSQGSGAAIDFSSKIIDLLAGREKAYEMTSQLVMAVRIYNYYEQCQTR